MTDRRASLERWQIQTQIEITAHTFTGLDILRVNAYTHTHTHTHTYIYIYIYIYTERERDRETDRQTERGRLICLDRRLLKNI